MILLGCNGQRAPSASPTVRYQTLSSLVQQGHHAGAWGPGCLCESPSDCAPPPARLQNAVAAILAPGLDVGNRARQGASDAEQGGGGGERGYKNPRASEAQGLTWVVMQQAMSSRWDRLHCYYRYVTVVSGRSNWFKTWGPLSRKDDPVEYLMLYQPKRPWEPLEPSEDDGVILQKSPLLSRLRYRSS
ncbi:hypothetical protein GQ53DRAFT_804959 [Thozetella sp. PMI_491]|nr:hypothetical protein GQ53DRAFT_804959 [Thozetella sp. PMI_491]